MPIYEYRCRECDAEFEKFVQAQTAVACPSCQSEKVMRRLSLFGTRSDSRATASPAGVSGGCCAGGCRCH